MDFLDYERPAVAADLVLFRVRDGKLQTGLIKRALQDVENGKWSLAGGFVDIDKTLKEILYGKAAEKLGFSCFSARQFTIRDNPARDDRWRVISCVYLGVLTDTPEQEFCTWFYTDRVGEGILYNDGVSERMDELAFDHASMITEAMDKLRHDLYTEEEGFMLTGEQFTLSELRSTFEAVLGAKIDNFTRKTTDLVEATGESVRGQKHRPAQIYRRKVQCRLFTGT